MNKKTFDEWLQEGLSLGFCGPAICYPHDGLPMTANEDESYSIGDNDPCIHILRLYEDLEIKKAVEDYHSPSVWRATNSGFDLEVGKD
jgi:hypothetical protein